MLIYANAIEHTKNTELFIQLSEYFSDKTSNLLMAGKFAGLAKNYSKVIIIKIIYQYILNLGIFIFNKSEYWKHLK